MSTHSFVGKVNEDGKTWEARFCHWDGTPEEMGNTILNNALIYGFKFVADFLLSTETRWSVLASCDFKLSPHTNPDNRVVGDHKAVLHGNLSVPVPFRPVQYLVRISSSIRSPETKSDTAVQADLQKGS